MKTSQPMQDWAVDCTVCGNVALAHLRNPQPIAMVANEHEADYPGHYVTVRATEIEVEQQ